MSESVAMQASDLLTTKEVADLARVSDQSIRRWVEQGRLRPAMQLPGGGLRFRRADVEAALAPIPVEAPAC